MDVTDRPIPPLGANEGWRDVPIAPIDEPLVAVDTLHRRIVDCAEYHRRGMHGALPRSWVRSGVADRLLRVVDVLPDGMGLAVWDGYRPLEVQASLFDTYLTELIAVHPELPADALEAAAAKYVTPPSHSRVAPPPHLTGGAVDLTLADGDGMPIELGTAFDAFVPEAGAASFEERPGTIRDLRRILFWAMHDAGFTAYAEEWWHFDHGDQFWGLLSGCDAIYGPAGAPPE